MALKAVLLDIDGTLVDSNDAHAKAWEQAFREFGYDVRFDEVRPLIGMGGDKIIPRYAPGLNDQEGTGKQLSQRRTEIFLEQVDQLEPTNGARALVEHMKRDGLQLIAASSSKQEELDHLLKAADVHDLLDGATTSSDAEGSKPEGDILHAALDKFGLKPDEVLLLGDTPYDIEAAEKAGIRTIMVRCGGWNDEDLRGALAVYKDPADLLQHYDRSALRQAAQQREA